MHAAAGTLISVRALLAASAGSASPRTLRKHYRHELDHGHSKANAKVAENLYHMALGQGREAVTAAIFWLKARARWKEVSVHEHGGSGEEPLRVNVIKRIIVSPPDREELRKIPGLAINTVPDWPNNDRP